MAVNCLANMKRQIYADNAATTRMSDGAITAMIPFMKDNYGNISQPYSFARPAKKALKDARELIASCIGADADEIYFTSGGTESDNWAIKGAWLQNRRIITSQIEHHAILNPCKFVESRGGNVEYLPVNESGKICVPDVTTRLHPASFLSVMTANNEIGTIEPIGELAQIAHHYDSLFHTDAVQAVGHIPINVHKMGIDFLSASAHKFNGPKGIGFLYVKRGIQWPALIDGGRQESGLRAGTENVASIVGMATALSENVKSMSDSQKHISKLVTLLLEMLSREQVSFVRNGDFCRLPGLVSLSFPNKDGEAILHRMDLNGISISTGSACDSSNTQISHVLT